MWSVSASDLRLVDLIASNRSRGLSAFATDAAYLQAAAFLRSCRRIAVVTGYFIPDAAAAETDGPLGSAALVRSLKRRGVDAFLTTDGLCAPVVKAAADFLGLRCQVCSSLDDVLEKNIDAIVFCERPGRTPDGTARSMRGYPLPPGTVWFDGLLSPYAISPVKSVAVGDGGNEAGMGNWRAEMSALKPDFSPYLAEGVADIPLAADVSEWGAWALAGLVESRGALSPDELQLGLEKLLKAGAVDGSTGERALSIDGYSLAHCAEKLKAVNDWCSAHPLTAQSDTGQEGLQDV